MNFIESQISFLQSFFISFFLHSGDVQERIWHKPGNKWGWLPLWSSFWSGSLSEPVARNSGPTIDQDMVTVVHEEVTYCSPTASSGKQKKIQSTSQPQSRSENTSAMIEADQILLAFRQLANNNSAKFHNNISRFSNLPKSLATTMPMFDGKFWVWVVWGPIPNEPQKS